MLLFVRVVGKVDMLGHREEVGGFVWYKQPCGSFKHRQTKTRSYGGAYLIKDFIHEHKVGLERFLRDGSKVRFKAFA